jgi:hypothetical protein
MAEHEVKLSDLRAGRVVLSSLSLKEKQIITARRMRREFVELGDMLLRFNSAVLLPGATSFTADGIPRPGLDLVAECLRYVVAHPEKQMVIAGHTDTVGSDEANVNLSRIRTDTVHGLLTGAREQFATACFGPHLTFDQRYPNGGDGSKKGVLWDDYSDVLTWAAQKLGWDCAHPNGSRTLWQATKNFEDSYNGSDVGDSANKPIPSDGIFTKATWGAMYDCYELKLAESLGTDLAGLADIRGKIVFVNPDVHCVACGEFKPIEQWWRDNYRSQTNRRVEVLFFDPDELPNPPCFSGACVAKLCDIYDDAIYKPKPVPAPPAPPAPTPPGPTPGPTPPIPPVTIEPRLHLRVMLDDAPVTQRGYELWSGSTMLASALTDSDGMIKEPLPSGLGEIELRMPERGLSQIFDLSGEADFPPPGEVEGAQVRLRQIGYYVGPADGNKDAVTDDAIRNFKVDHGLPDDSVLDGDTADALESVYGS